MYTGKVRVRVCGILIEDDKVLLLKHKGLGKGGHIWSFPGGGPNFGEDSQECLKREFEEETGLLVEVQNFLFVNVYRDEHLHAVQLFFRVDKIGGQLSLGSDPELKEQILEDVQWIGDQELNEIASINKHNIFSEIDDLSSILKLTGYYNFDNS